LQLSSAVSARRAGKPSPPAPPTSTDNRRSGVPLAPSIAIWDTAQTRCHHHAASRHRDRSLSRHRASA
jgi:hypothetical protein